MTTNNLNRDALVVGICQYGDLPMSEELETLAKQAEQLAQLLETQGGFKVTRLPCATDLTLSLNRRVTLPELEQAIEKLLYPPEESPTQTALLFFAGHGLVKSSRLGTEGFLATSEADGRSVYGFSLKDLRELLRHSPVKQQIVWLEACHSGALFTDIEIEKERDCCFVTSARANEEALAQGLLTNALLEILDYTHQAQDTPWVHSDTLIEGLRQKLITTEGWQRFEVQTQGHLMLTNHAFSQQVDPNAKPYKGLHYFDNKPEDALFFKGREKLITELLTKVTEKSFLAILGASGNGKSSVVRAGVLYQLQQTGSCEIVNPFTPTANPLTALTNGLGTTEVLTFVQASAKARVILTIDQFEEVFSLCQENQARDTFFNTLLDAVEQAGEKLCLLVVMRADFMDKCSQYPRLARYFQDHQHIVTRPTEAEIQQIIEAPAKQAGLSVEPRLVAEMITDFKDSLGGLPLLEFALTTLWEKGKADRLLRYADYQALGRIQGILEKKATATYEELTPAEQVVAKRIFLELTELGEGRHDTRRLVPQTELLGFATRTASPSRTGSPEPSVEQVIAKLVKEHLIVTDKTEMIVVNIAHDALIEHWSVLRKWLDQSREDLKLQRQINEGAKAWQAGKKALLVGVDLARAEEYLGTHLERVALIEVGVEFVKKSVEKRRQTRRFWADLVLAIFLSLSVLTGWALFEQKKARVNEENAITSVKVASDEEKKAKHQAKVAQVHRLGTQALLAAQSPSSVNGHFDRASLLAAQAFQIINDKETRSNLFLVLTTPQYLPTYLPQYRADRTAFSPDGKLLAVAYNGTTFLLDVKTQHLLGKPLEIQGDSSTFSENECVNVIFSPDGKILASTTGYENPDGNSMNRSNMMGVTLWDLMTRSSKGQPLRIKEDITSLSFSTDNKLFAVSGSTGDISLWEVATQSSLGYLQGQTEQIKAVTFSLDSKILAGFDGTVVWLWDVATQQPLGQLSQGYNDFAWAKSAVCSGTFSSNSRLFATDSEDGKIVLWDMETLRPFASLQEHSDQVYALAFSEDGKLLASGSRDGTIVLSDVVTQRRVGQLFPNNNISSLTFSPDSKLLVCGSLDSNFYGLVNNTDNVVTLWDLSNPPLGRLSQRHGGTVSSIAFSPNGKLFASADDSREGTIILWDVATYQPLGSPLRGHSNRVNSIAFSPNSKTLVSGSEDNTIILWDVVTHQQTASLLHGHDYNVKSVAFNPNGEMLASGGEVILGDGKSIILWNVTTQQSIGLPLRVDSGGVKNIVFSPDGKTLTSGDSYDVITLWDVTTHQPRSTLKGYREYVGSGGNVDFSPDGKLLAIAGDIGTVVLWDMATQHLWGKPLQGHSNQLNASTIEDVAFSPDGKLLASVGVDGAIILWDVATQRPLERLLQRNKNGNLGWSVAVAFSPDGKILASGSSDGTIILWDVDPQSWYQKACRIAGRNLTYEEWQRYLPDKPYQKTCPQYPNKAKVLESVSGLTILRLTPRIDEIVNVYIDHYLMPRKLQGDARHLAYASLYQMNFLLTWNCNHLANVNKKPHILTINTRLGLPLPEIVTPLQLFKEKL